MTECLTAQDWWLKEYICVRRRFCLGIITFLVFPIKCSSQLNIEHFDFYFVLVESFCLMKFMTLPLTFQSFDMFCIKLNNTTQKSKKHYRIPLKICFSIPEYLLVCLVMLSVLLWNMEPLDSLKPFGGKSLSWLRIYSLDLASFHSAKWFLKEREMDRQKERGLHMKLVRGNSKEECKNIIRSDRGLQN